MRTPLETALYENIFDKLGEQTTFDVSHYLGWGLNCRQIGEILGISQQVANYHRHKLRKRFYKKQRGGERECQ